MKYKISILLIIILLTAANASSEIKPLPAVQNGVIDLRNWDFHKDGIVMLDGKWEFYWHHFLTPGDNSKENMSGYIDVPIAWDRQSIDNEPIPTKGYATYRILVYVSDISNSYSLYISLISSSAQVYLNGKLVSKLGTIGKNEDQTRGRYNLPIASITPKTDAIEIIIHASNFSNSNSGIRSSVSFGITDQVYSKYENNVATCLFLAGALFIIAMYHLVVFFMRKKDLTSLYFSLWCFTIATRTIAAEPYFLQILLPDLPYILYHQFLMIPIFLSIPLTIMYVYSVFPQDFFKIVMRYFQIQGVVFSVVNLFAPAFYFIIIQIHLLTSVIGFLYIIVVSIIAIKRKREGSVIFLFSLITAFIATLSELLYYLDIIPVKIITLSSGMLLFSLFQAILIARLFSNAYKVKEILSTKLKDLNQNLENKVNERTDELRSANEEMGALNTMLLKTRDELWGEMELAKKIQTVLLPKEQKLPGYNVCGFMKPADEVGGDYYDIIHYNGGNWIVIGDVSGHGVTAGLVMMMVQTAIQTIVRNNPDIQPSILLNSINKSIRYNITNMKNNDYITMTVLSLQESGEVKFAGRHQNILIHRHESDRIEVVETNGVWVGLLDNVETIMKDSSIELHKDDTMLLYTDGITEAWQKIINEEKHDFKKDLFGEKRLQAAFKSVMDKPGNDIIRSIMNSVVDYNIDDDVTMVVVKKM